MTKSKRRFGPIQGARSASNCRTATNSLGATSGKKGKAWPSAHLSADKGRSSHRSFWVLLSTQRCETQCILTQGQPPFFTSSVWAVRGYQKVSKETVLLQHAQSVWFGCWTYVGWLYQSEKARGRWLCSDVSQRNTSASVSWAVSGRLRITIGLPSKV